MRAIHAITVQQASTSSDAEEQLSVLALFAPQTVVRLSTRQAVQARTQEPAPTAVCAILVTDLVDAPQVPWQTHTRVSNVRLESILRVAGGDHAYRVIKERTTPTPAVNPILRAVHAPLESITLILDRLWNVKSVEQESITL